MLYLEFIKKAFREKYVYRFDFYVSIIASFITIYIQIEIWQALYKGRPNINSVSLDNMLNYVILSFVVMNLTKSNVSSVIADKIATGAVVSDFIKPINFKYYLFAEDLGTNLFNTVFVTAPSLLFAYIFLGVSIKLDLITFLLFLTSLFLGIFISLYINYIIGLFAFWLESSWYLKFYLGALLQLFSGASVPIWFYPNWLKLICDWLPFKFIFFDPISIYLGKVSLIGEYRIILYQMIWVFLLYLIERIVWSNVNKRITVHGG